MKFRYLWLVYECVVAHQWVKDFYTMYQLSFSIIHTELEKLLNFAAKLKIPNMQQNLNFKFLFHSRILRSTLRTFLRYLV